MKKVVLPSGQSVACISRRDALLIYDDIYESECYRHGIKYKEGDVIINIGANIGLFECWLEQLNLGKITVYAFEPIPELYDALRTNTTPLVYIDVIGVRAAVDCDEGTEVMTYYPRLPSASTAHPDDPMTTRTRDHAYIRSQMPGLLAHVVPGFLIEWIRRWHLRPQKITCPAVSLPVFMKEKEIDKVDLLKIDAEGSEWGIIDSMNDSDWKKIKQVVIEVHGGQKSSWKLQRYLLTQGFSTSVYPNPAIPQLDLVFGVKS